MGVFEQFPYTNFHGVNLDWILKAIREHETRLDTLESWKVVTDGRLDSLESRMDSAETKIESLEGVAPVLVTVGETVEDMDAVREALTAGRPLLATVALDTYGEFYYLPCNQWNRTLQRIRFYWDDTGAAYAADTGIAAALYALDPALVDNISPQATTHMRGRLTLNRDGSWVGDAEVVS